MALREEPRIKRSYLIALGVAALVAVAGILFMTFSGGGDEPELPSSTFGAAPPVAAPPVASPTPRSADIFETFEGRDPFRPLIVAAPVGAAGPAGSPAPGGPAPAPAPGPSASESPNPTPRPARDGVQVEVLSVAEDSKSATVKVGSKVHENARPGETLSDGVQIVSIEGECVNFRRGDDGFRLCEGEQVL
ncbi:MAG TPA: hypothetical protein VNE62_11125, partial [Actinomycetota bacterium]|nr:hypothetical protein [Actinomycetota bacterium]